MHEFADGLAGALVNPAKEGAAAELAREFEARLADCSKLAFRVAYGVLRHREDAEDVAQEAFVRANRNFHRLRDRNSFRAWLVRMTWRLAIDHKRSALRRMVREQYAVVEDRAPTSEDDVIAEERALRLWAAIDELPEQLRLATVLAAMEGLDLDEVARLTGSPVGTVKSRLFDARRMLKERLR
jgi:RNA polymerase sigma-70 factor (ECF subfamily)